MELREFMLVKDPCLRRCSDRGAEAVSVDIEILCHQITFLSSSVNSYIGNHATHFLVIGNGCYTHS